MGCGASQVAADSGSGYAPAAEAPTTDVSNFDRIESKVDFFAGEPYDFSDARQWDVDF